jgi:hypothetical protein
MISYNEQGIDESQFLPAGVLAVNKYRLAKGDMHYSGTAEGTHFTHDWFPDKLAASGIITHEHLAICACIFIATVSTMNALGVRRLRAFLGEYKGGVPTGAADKIYSALIREMRPDSFNILYWIMDDDRNCGNLALAYNLRHSIVEAIEAADSIACKAKKNNVDA